MILPSSLSVLNAVYRGKTERRIRSMGRDDRRNGAMGLVGGGTTNASWHWAFLINVPIALAVFIGVLLMVPGDQGHHPPPRH